jgi:hypothetical protein
MSPAVGRLPRIEEVRVKYKATHCGICGVYNATGPLLSPRVLYWHLSVLIQQCCILIYRYVAIVV